MLGLGDVRRRATLPRRAGIAVLIAGVAACSWLGGYALLLALVFAWALGWQWPGPGPRIAAPLAWAVVYVARIQGVELGEMWWIYPLMGIGGTAAAVASGQERARGHRIARQEDRAR